HAVLERGGDGCYNLVSKRGSIPGPGRRFMGLGFQRFSMFVGDWVFQNKIVELSNDQPLMNFSGGLPCALPAGFLGELPVGFLDKLPAGFSNVLTAHCVEIAGHIDVCRRIGGCGSYAYIVVVLCTESVVCGLASHTSLGDSPVAHPSFFPLQHVVLERGGDGCYNYVPHLRRIHLAYASEQIHATGSGYLIDD
ncbi:unnamed protein product, partial [Brassica napus]